jgi:S-adenosylmethionine/arginine decarboxylase-like enzyme
MTHILLDIKYKTTESILYDTNRGESVIKNWCEYNNHSLVMPPVTHIFPSYNERNLEKIIEGFFQSSLTNCDYGYHGYHDYDEDNEKKQNSKIGTYNGYTSVGLLKESHISIHTYPEHNSIQIDFFSCKNLNKRQNVEYMERVFRKSEATKFDYQFIEREIV